MYDVCMYLYLSMFLPTLFCFLFLVESKCVRYQLKASNGGKSDICLFRRGWFHIHLHLPTAPPMANSVNEMYRFVATYIFCKGFIFLTLFHPAGGFSVVVQQTDAAARCGLQGAYRLQVGEEDLSLRESENPRTIWSWPYRLLRRYGKDHVREKCTDGRGFPEQKCCVHQNEFIGPHWTNQCHISLIMIWFFVWQEFVTKATKKKDSNTRGLRNMNHLLTMSSVL